MIDARNEIEAGTIGDIFAMRATQLGAVGVVTDGAVRDTPALREMGIPVYHRASHGATYRRLHMPVDQQVPIACAGVTVVPGDVIVGDEEGVVVVPAAIVDEVAAEAAQQELEEEWAMTASPPATAPTVPSRSRPTAGRSSRRGFQGARACHDPPIVRRRVGCSTRTRSPP